MVETWTTGFNFIKQVINMHPIRNWYATDTQPIRNRYATETQPRRTRYATDTQPRPNWYFLFVVSAVHFAPYLTGLSSMMLIWAAGARCKWRAHLHNRMSWQRLEPRTSSRWASTLPLSYPATHMQPICSWHAKLSIHLGLYQLFNIFMN